MVDGINNNYGNSYSLGAYVPQRQGAEPENVPAQPVVNHEETQVDADKMLELMSQSAYMPPKAAGVSYPKLSAEVEDRIGKFVGEFEAFMKVATDEVGSVDLALIIAEEYTK